jgi:hypothetical protein
MASTATVMVFRDGARPDEPTTLTTLTATTKPFRPSSPTPSTLDEILSDDTNAQSLGLLVARQGGSSYPSDSDDADTGGGHNMSTYYFVFFALLICIAVLCVYFVWKKRRNALRVYSNPHGPGYNRDVREWDTARHRHRYWNTQHRNEQASREEGLNEDGEAPPPYMPKDDEETGNAGRQVNGQLAHGGNTPVPGEPAIPMQTLSRDHAGLKPPGYEQSVQPVGDEPSGSRLP